MAQLQILIPVLFLHKTFDNSIFSQSIFQNVDRSKALTNQSGSPVIVLFTTLVSSGPWTHVHDILFCTFVQAISIIGPMRRVAF